MKSLRRLSATVFLFGRRVSAEAGKGRAQRTIRMMFRHTWLVAISVLLLLAGLVGGSVYLASRPTVLKFAVAPPGTDDARMVVSLAQQLSRDKAHVRLRVAAKQTQEEAIAAFDHGEADLIIARGDGKRPESGQAVAILRHHVLVLMVPAQGSVAWGTAQTRAARGMRGPAVKKLEQLAAHRIGVVGSVEDARGPLNAVLSQQQIPADKITFVPLAPNDLANALKDNPVDVLLVVAPMNSKVIQNAVAVAAKGRESPVFLDIAASEAIVARLPSYESTEIKAGAFGGTPPRPEEAVETIGFSYYIMARKGLSEAVVTELTRLVFLYRQRLTMDFPETAKIEAPDTDKGAEIPVHPGAAAYIDDNQKTFFDRYDDLIYMGIMVLSFLGSAIAWLTSYLRADGKLRRLKILERMLEIAQAAREARDVATLDTLDAEVTEIVTKTVKQAEKPDFDADSLQVLAFAVDHARYSILDRRAGLLAEQAAVLGGEPAPDSADDEAHEDDTALRPIAIVSR